MNIITLIFASFGAISLIGILIKILLQLCNWLERVRNLVNQHDREIRNVESQIENLREPIRNLTEISRGCSVWKQENGRWIVVSKLYSL